MITRRGFLSALAALPVVGRLVARDNPGSALSVAKLRRAKHILTAKEIVARSDEYSRSPEYRELVRAFNRLQDEAIIRALSR